MNLRRTVLATVAFGALAAPATAGAHATVSPLQPQGTPLTSARTLYVLRVPNERVNDDTFRVVLRVPRALQASISLTKKPGWDVRLTTRRTGERDDEGNPVTVVTKVAWTAKPGSEIEPRFFDDFQFRAQNPAIAGQVCFPARQVYGTTTTRRSGGRATVTRKVTETVDWFGPETADTPASCVDIAAA